MLAPLRRRRSNVPMTTVRDVPRILCVDDDPEFLTSLQLRLGEYQLEVEKAFHGMEGIVESISKQPDLILMDLAMPNGDGTYLIQCVKKNSATTNIPVIVLTGMRDRMLKKKLLCLGASRFLNKPIHFESLLRHLRSFVPVSKRTSAENSDAKN